MSAQTIFEQLRKAGCTPTGALALMGNWQEESGLEGYRLQGDFQTDRFPSKEYARKVDNGFVSDEWFYKDGKGWGIPQFTFWTRKKGFLQFCRSHSISIGNETANVDYALIELKTEPQYANLWKLLSTCEEGQLWDATDRVCREFERPARINTQVRYNYALELKKQLQSQAAEQIDNGVDIYWPPRMLCYNMTGPDVTVLQALLLAHGYNPGGCSGIYNSGTKTAVMSFQKANGLAVDGIAGPITFKALGVVA